MSVANLCPSNVCSSGKVIRGTFSTVCVEILTCARLDACNRRKKNETWRTHQIGTEADQVTSWDMEKQGRPVHNKICLN